MYEFTDEELRTLAEVLFYVDSDNVSNLEALETLRERFLAYE